MLVGYRIYEEGYAVLGGADAGGAETRACVAFRRRNNDGAMLLELLLLLRQANYAVFDKNGQHHQQDVKSRLIAQRAGGGKVPCRGTITPESDGFFSSFFFFFFLFLLSSGDFINK